MGGRPAWVTVAVWWALLAAAYLSFVTATWQETVAAVCVAALGAGITAMALRTGEITVPAVLPQLWRLPTIVRIAVREGAHVLRGLARRLRGRRPAGRFVAVHLDGPVGAATDAAITVEASLAPNTYVVGVLDDDRLLLLHQFEAAPHARRSFPRWAP